MKKVQSSRFKVQGSVALIVVLFLAVPAFAGWLGIGVSEVTADKLSALKLKEERGVEIVSVSSNSPAAQGGLKEHDVVLEYNGQRVDGNEQFQRLVRETPAGRTVKLLVSRDGATQTISVKVGDRPTPRARVIVPGDHEWSFNMPPMPSMPVMPEIPDMRDFQVFTTSSTRLGIDAEQLTKQLGEYFGAPGGEGVLVRSVERDSPAEKAGIKAGDVVLKVDGEKIATVRDLRSALRDRSDKKTWSVVLLRNHKEMTVTVNNERSEHRSDLMTPGEKV